MPVECPLSASASLLVDFSETVYMHGDAHVMFCPLQGRCKHVGVCRGGREMRGGGGALLGWWVEGGGGDNL